MKKGIAALLVIALILILGVVIAIAFGPGGKGFGQFSFRQNQQQSQAEAVDSDYDGFNDTVETFMGTDTKDGCPNDVNHNAWPPDLNNNKSVDVSDQVLLASKIKKPKLYSTRFDFNMDRRITDADNQILQNYFGQECKVFNMVVEPSESQVTFKWAPPIAGVEGSLFVMDMTEFGLNSCIYPDDYKSPEIYPDLHTGDSTFEWRTSIPTYPIPVAGHKYCAVLRSLGLSNTVTFTMPGVAPTSKAPANLAHCGFLSAAELGGQVLFGHNGMPAGLSRYSNNPPNGRLDLGTTLNSVDPFRLVTQSITIPATLEPGSYDTYIDADGYGQISCGKLVLNLPSTF